MPVDHTKLNFLCRHYGIGLTGGVATGKSTISRLLETNYLVIDADHLARIVVKPGTPALRDIVVLFGDRILHDDGSLNRRSMREKIQASTHDRRQLENIIHPAIQDRLFYELESKGILKNPQPWFYEASLLVEKKKTSNFLDIWLTDCSKRTQIQRLMARDHISDSEAESFIHTQAPQEEKKQHAQVIINTDQPLTELKTHLDHVVQTRLSALGLHSVIQG